MGRGADPARSTWRRRVPPGVEPLGAKLGPLATPEEAVALCDALDLRCEPGRLTLIARLGAGKVAATLPGLLEAVKASGHPVVWACDPMHGNTFVGAGGRKTRHFDHVLAKITEFFEVCRALTSGLAGFTWS